MIFGGISVTPFHHIDPQWFFVGVRVTPFVSPRPQWFLAGVSVTPIVTPRGSSQVSVWHPLQHPHVLLQGLNDVSAIKKVKAIRNPKTCSRLNGTRPHETRPVSWMAVGSELVNTAGRYRTCSRIRMIMKILNCTTMQDICRTSCTKFVGGVSNPPTQAWDGYLSIYLDYIAF